MHTTTIVDIRRQKVNLHNYIYIIVHFAVQSVSRRFGPAVPKSLVLITPKQDATNLSANRKYTAVVELINGASCA